VGFSSFAEARFSAASLEIASRPVFWKKSPAEAGFEKEEESETPRLKAGAKKSPLKRAGVLFQSPDFWILLFVPGASPEFAGRRVVINRTDGG